MMRRRDNPMLEAQAEQRRREDSAPRLQDEFATLRSLRFVFGDQRTDDRMTAASYVRPIVVATAPALFEIRCMEPRCDGRHDLTRSVLNALQRSESSFAGQSTCFGMVRDTPCDHTLAYTGEATYATQAS